MLLRLVDHFRDNPKRIDKLIAVKGLPEEWFFTERDGHKELKKPWEADIDKNIPHDIRHLCDPMYIVLRYPPIEKGRDEVIEKRRILGVRIDYNSEPGRQMWDDIERYIEETLPRNERIPVPVLCSRDERSAFETFTPRRTARGSLELVPNPVPFVDLTKYVLTKVEEVKVKSPLVVNNPAQTEESMVSARPTQQSFTCEECDFTHHSPRGVRMHAVKRHPKKEKVGTV
jgi:hypothetical protein